MLRSHTEQGNAPGVQVSFQSLDESVNKLLNLKACFDSLLVVTYFGNLTVEGSPPMVAASRCAVLTVILAIFVLRTYAVWKGSRLVACSLAAVFVVSSICCLVPD